MNISFTEKQKAYIVTQTQVGNIQNACEALTYVLNNNKVCRYCLIENLKKEPKELALSYLNSVTSNNVLEHQ